MVGIITWIIQKPSNFELSFSIAKWAILTGILLKIMKASLKIMTKMNIFSDNNEKPKYNPRRRNRRYISAKKKGKLTKIGNKRKCRYRFLTVFATAAVSPTLGYDV